MNHRQFFDKAADGWDDEKREFLNLLRIVKMADIQKGERILDIGSGTGRLLPLLGEAAGREGIVIALDLSHKMLKLSQKKFRARFFYIQGDAKSIPFKSVLFDRVVCLNAFPHFPDKETAIFEMKRVLSPGGELLIVHTAGREAVNTLHKRIGGIVGHDYIPDEQEMVHLFEKAGFTEIDIVDAKDFYWASGVAGSPYTRTT